MSKSIVIPNGMAIWSVRAYRRPIEPLLASTLCDTSCCVSATAGRERCQRFKRKFKAYLLQCLKLLISLVIMLYDIAILMFLGIFLCAYYCSENNASSVRFSRNCFVLYYYV